MVAELADNGDKTRGIRPHPPSSTPHPPPPPFCIYLPVFFSKIPRVTAVCLAAAWLGERVHGKALPHPEIRL